MPATSSNMDVKYLASNFIPLITVDDPDEENANPQLEIFSSAAIKLDRLIQPIHYYQYRKERLPVITRRLLNNTSCWWMVLLASGKIHPFIIDAGEILVIPDINLMRTALQVQNTNVSRIPRFVQI